MGKCHKLRSHIRACLATGPAPHRVSQALRPRTPEESEKSPERVPRARPQKCRKSAPWSLKKKSPKRVGKSGFRLFSDAFETPRHALSALWPCPGVLFSDSSAVPGPKGMGDPVWGGADRKACPPSYPQTHHCNRMTEGEGWRGPLRSWHYQEQRKNRR